jgi:hypothetical protein
MWSGEGTGVEKFTWRITSTNLESTFIISLRNGLGGIERFIHLPKVTASKGG